MAVRPLFGLSIAFNKVRVPGWVTLATGIFNLLLAIGLVRAGWGVLGIAASGALSLTLRNLFFTSIYTARIQKLPWHTYIKELLALALLNGVFAGLVLGINRLVVIKTWLVLALLASAAGLAYSLFVYGLVLKKEEKTLLWQLLPFRMRPGYYEND
jgi:membrane protein EpsK